MINHHINMKKIINIAILLGWMLVSASCIKIEADYHERYVILNNSSEDVQLQFFCPNSDGFSLSTFWKIDAESEWVSSCTMKLAKNGGRATTDYYHLGINNYSPSIIYSVLHPLLGDSVRLSVDGREEITWHKTIPDEPGSIYQMDNWLVTWFEDDLTEKRNKGETFFVIKDN